MYLADRSSSMNRTGSVCMVDKVDAVQLTAAEDFILVSTESTELFVGRAARAPNQKLRPACPMGVVGVGQTGRSKNGSDRIGGLESVCFVVVSVAGRLSVLHPLCQADWSRNP